MRRSAHFPRFLERGGRPFALVGSGEHYGAVLNTDFDFRPYLDAMAADGLNHCRIFSGSYREVPGSFGIVHNTLAPRDAAFRCPWRRLPDGRWDLHHWDEAYWGRLKQFCALAAERHIVVELVLFCFWYEDALWAASPMHPDNNVQGVGPRDRRDVYADSGPLLHVQQAMVRKAADDLRGLSNVVFEICNEPYCFHDHGWFADWHAVLADTIVLADPHRLIAVNVQNRTARIDRLGLHPAVSIVNFHYAVPEAAQANLHTGLVLADDETGFAGQTADPYRREAWRFFLAGGSAFSHLDYSFTVAHPGGDAPIEGTTPGYGGADLRRQLGFLRRFVEKIEVWRLHPMNELFAWNAGDVPALALGLPGRRYALHFPAPPPQGRCQLALPSGRWHLWWLDPVGCRDLSESVLAHPGGYGTVEFPAGVAEAALAITREDVHVGS